MERLDKFAFGTVTKVLMLCTIVSHQWAVPDTDFPVDQCDSCKALDHCSTRRLFIDDAVSQGLLLDVLLLQSQRPGNLFGAVFPMQLRFCICNSMHILSSQF